MSIRRTTSGLELKTEGRKELGREDTKMFPVVVCRWEHSYWSLWCGSGCFGEAEPNLSPLGWYLHDDDQPAQNQHC